MVIVGESLAAVAAAGVSPAADATAGAMLFAPAALAMFLSGAAYLAAATVSTAVISAAAAAVTIGSGLPPHGDGAADSTSSTGSPRVHSEYTKKSMTLEQIADILPAWPSFRTLDELRVGCRSEIVFPTGIESKPELTAGLEEFRLHLIGFFNSGYPLLGPDPVFRAIMSGKKDVAAVCPFAVMQVLLIRIEELLVRIYQGSSQHRNQHLEAFSEATQLHVEVSMLQRWVLELIPDALDEDPETPLGWPLKQARARCQRYYDILWDDVHDSQETWAVMEQPGEITDELYHAAFAEVAKVLDSISDGSPSQRGGGVEWWPCRGTLIAFLRHGARSGSLSRGLVDVVERDIDIMLGIPDEAAWNELGRKIELDLKALGWERCWTKSSVTEDQLHLRDVARRDLLYCVRMTPAYMMVDITSYITGAPDPHVFVHRVCTGAAAAWNIGEAALRGAIVATAKLRADGTEALGFFGENCTVPSNVGPLRHGGGLLRRDAIYPLGRCKADSLSVPCPQRPLETIRAMVHSGLDAGCLALPTVKGRDPEDEATKRLKALGLCAEDVGILRERSAWLQAMGYQSMAPLFGECDGLVEVLATPC